MIRCHRRFATLPVAFFLLTSAATARADSPWVLWQTTHSDVGLRYYFVSAYNTKQECEAHIDRETKVVYKWERGREDLVAFSNHICLPGSFDPRGRLD